MNAILLFPAPTHPDRAADQEQLWGSAEGGAHLSGQPPRAAEMGSMQDVSASWRRRENRAQRSSENNSLWGQLGRNVFRASVPRGLAGHSAGGPASPTTPHYAQEPPEVGPGGVQEAGVPSQQAQGLSFSKSSHFHIKDLQPPRKSAPHLATPQSQSSQTPQSLGWEVLINQTVTRHLILCFVLSRVCYNTNNSLHVTE